MLQDLDLDQGSRQEHVLLSFYVISSTARPSSVDNNYWCEK